MENTTWTINGVSTPLVTKEAIENRKKFPLLGRLFVSYDKLYSFLSEALAGRPDQQSQREDQRSTIFVQ